MSNDKIEYRTIPIEGIKHVTEKAILVITLEHQEAWIPRSTVPIADDAMYDEFDPNQTEIRVARWLCDKRGW